MDKDHSGYTMEESFPGYEKSTQESSVIATPQHWTVSMYFAIFKTDFAITATQKNRLDDKFILILQSNAKSEW